MKESAPDYKFFKKLILVLEIIDYIEMFIWK